MVDLLSSRVVEGRAVAAERQHDEAGEAKLLSILFVAMLALLPSSAHARPKDRSPEARELLREGRDRYAEGSLEERRSAIRRIEQAALLVPHDTHVLDELGRAYLDAGFTH